MNNHFTELFLKHDGKRIDKWEQYVGIYQAELASLIERGTPVRLLEIGVQNGGSLEFWSRYLPPGSVIRGIDIDERVGDLSFEGANIAVNVADATDALKIEALLGNETFDVIIDDGSHQSGHVIASFGILYPHLSAGGKYVVEDLHCSYFASHQGGYRAGHSSIEWLKHLIDVLNADYIAPSDDIPPLEQELIRAFRTSLARVTFYDSVAVVEKLSAEKTRPYRRTLTGCHAPLVPDDYWVSVAPAGSFRPMLFGQAAARQLESTLITRLEEVDAKAAQLDGALSEAQRQLEDARQQALRLASEASDALVQREAEHQSQLQAALDEREATHQEALRAALAERDAAMRVALDERHAAMRATLAEHEAAARAALAEREAVHRHALRTAIHTREVAFRRELGATLSLAMRVRTGLRVGAGAVARGLGRALRTLGIARSAAATMEGVCEAALCRPLFDDMWYLQRYPDVAASGVDPLEHYLGFGAAEKRDPNPFFSTAWYLERNPDVAAAGTNPLLHYAMLGAAEGRDPHELFDTDWYLKRNPDVAASGMNPLAHYLAFGVAEGREPSAPTGGAR